MEMEKKYTARDIEVLEGLEAVRRRPAMFIGGIQKAGFHHLLWEILDNAVDEAINGFADQIEVTIFPDGKTASVRDNGRGIPTDIHPRYKKPALELILTTLHSGGKFSSKNYYHSGGLHGVGVSVVNALSEYLRAEVWRDGYHFAQEYRRGVPVGPMEKTPLPQRERNRTGTKITFRPDPEIFGHSAEFDTELIRERLQLKAHLHSKLKIQFTDLKNEETVQYYSENGLSDYLKELLQKGNRRVVGEQIFQFESGGELKFETVLCWTDATDERFLSFANGIPTRQGGTHEAALKSAIVKAVRSYISNHKIQIKGVQITAEDIREGCIGLISVYLREPQFQGQTKDRLNNPEVSSAVEQPLRTALEQWLNENSRVASAIIERIVTAARVRTASKAASQSVRKRQARRKLTLPGKLADCSLDDPEKTELFIVEGDSAGGSAKMARDRKTQAVLPLRGKVLNTESINPKKLMANREISDIINALGCGFGPNFDIGKLRYHKIILLMDADADGNHIATLLLTFFYRHLPELIHRGHVYIAQPPLYRIIAGKKNYWVLDDEEKEKVLASLPKNTKVEIQRFKGLGEMRPQVLKETTLDPKRRTLLKVVVDDPIDTDRIIGELMGKNPAHRFKFISENAPKVEDIDA